MSEPRDTDSAAEARALLQNFYAGTDANRIDYARAFDPDTDSDGYRRIQRWAAPLAEDQPGVLVCNTPAGAVWYGVARSERDLRRLAEELIAFVGPSVSDVTRDRAQLGGDDPIEAAVAAYSGGHAIRFRGDDEGVAASVDRLFQVRSRRQTRVPVSTSSPGLVLRRFHMALVAGLPDEAEGALRELSERALLTPLNLHFLRVQKLAAFARWSDIVGNKPLVPLDHLLAVRRPRAVTEAIIQAVYHQVLNAHEGAPEAFVEAFRSTVEPQFSGLFTAPTGLHSTEALRSFMALAATTGDPGLRDRVSDSARDAGVEDALLGALAALVEGVSDNTRTIEAAEEAAQRGDYGLAFEIAGDLGASVRAARVLLRCAYEVQSTEIEAAAVEAVGGLSDADRSALFASRLAREAYEEISGRGEGDHEAGTVPTSWAEWLGAVLDGSLSHARAVSLAASGSHEWTVEGLMKDGEEEALSDALLDAATAGAAWGTVQPVVPHLIGSFQRDPHYPRPELSGLYRSLLQCIAATDAPGDADLGAFTDLGDAVLRGPVDAAEYRVLVDDGVRLWERSESARRLDWLLDTLELLAVHSVPDEAARLRFLAVAVDAFRRYRDRASDDQLDLLASLALETGNPDVADDLIPHPVEERSVDPYAALAGHRIAIYTLNERAASRVQDYLAERCPSAQVDLAHDTVCTDHLIALSRAADLFVVATSSATHAATDCISQHYEGHPIYPVGKGSASILASLRNWAASA